MYKNHEKNKKTFLLVAGIILFVWTIGGFFSSILNQENHATAHGENGEEIVAGSKEEKEKIAALIPTLLIHGNGGSEWSFTGMSNRMDEAGFAEKAMKVYVSEAGQLDVEGELTATQHNPLVHVIFANNHEDDEGVASEWVFDVVKMLQKRYGIKAFYGLGHSNGGPVLLRYAIDHSRDKDLPKMLKLVSLGGPMNGEFVGKKQAPKYDLDERGWPITETPRYTYYREHFNQIDPNIHFLNVAADIGDGRQNDGSVTLPSVLSVGNLAVEHGLDYEEKVFVGKEFYHSALHENHEVDELVSDYLWSEE